MHRIHDALQGILRGARLPQRASGGPDMQHDQRGQERERNRNGDGLLRSGRCLDTQHDRGQPVTQAMRDDQRDVMNRERHEGHQSEKVQAAGGLPSAEQAWKPRETAGERG